MAIVLKFKQGDSGTELNLNAGETGFQLAGDGWNPAVATPVHMGDPPPISEFINLLLKHSSHDNIATSVQSLHEMQVLANRYINDPHQETPVWLHAKMANETGERRALVHSITIQYKTSWFGAPATALDIPLVITVVRGPYWESTTVRNLPDAAPAAAASIVYDYTAAGDSVTAHNTVGDVGARIRFFDIRNNFDLHRYWMGIRSAGKHGATGVSNFEEIWEAEAGTPGLDTTETGEGTASGGNMDVVAESFYNWDTPTFFDVFTISLDQLSANEEDLFGNFLFLMRAKVASGTWETRLEFAPGIGDSFVKKDIVEINDTDWNYYEMGTQAIGFRNLHAITDGDFSKSVEGKGFIVALWARRTSGSGNLHIDCLCPIPIDEGFIKLEGTINSASVEHVMFGHSPEGHTGALSWDNAASEAHQKIAIKGIDNFTLPPGDGRIYCVYSPKAGDSDVLTNTIVFNDGDVGRYYERWLSLRGGE